MDIMVPTVCCRFVVIQKKLKDIEQAKAQGGCADHIEKNFFVIHILNSLSC